MRQDTEQEEAIFEEGNKVGFGHLPSLDGKSHGQIQPSKEERWKTKENHQEFESPHLEIQSGENR